MTSCAHRSRSGCLLTRSEHTITTCYGGRGRVRAWDEVVEVVRDERVSGTKLLGGAPRWSAYRRPAPFPAPGRRRRGRGPYGPARA